jgi:alpha/beta superfamily hydrolase
MRTDIDFPVTFDGHGVRRRTGRVHFAASRTRGCAIFAHFLVGASAASGPSTIARQLGRAGVSTLSLNFAAVEDSHAPWEVEDLVAAAGFAARSLGPVRLLVGQGIAGAALLAPSSAIDGVEGVATIGTPYQARYVRRLLSGAGVETWRSSGSLDGLPFTMSGRLIEDLAAQEELGTIASPCRSLLVIRGATDEVVPVSEALRIASAARGQRLVALVRGDHQLLSAPRSAGQVARILEAWAAALVCRPTAGRGTRRCA